MLSDLDRISALRAALPAEGLFAEKEWRISPDAFRIPEPLVEQLEKLGHRLLLFNRACNELYHRSISGKQPAWIADYLDRGKPAELVEFSRSKEFRHDLPAVIRPDVILTEEGFTIAELDSVPGGIGLTAWLNTTYSALGIEVLGGPRGMIDGFHAIAPGADILVSEESATYRPEMEWIAQFTGQRVVAAETYQPCVDASQSRNVYRFFEQFDLPNIASAGGLMEAALSAAIRITPPLKPYLEEKLWFGLFWMQPLREFWRRELGERHFLELQKHIPYTWILDPTPLPHHAVLPGLEINDWRELGQLSQKQRELILKISGFSERAWGSRSVVLGSDVSQADWQQTVKNALDEFPHHPHVLQRFHKGRVVEQPVFNPVTCAVEPFRGRVRLCPYYFVASDKAELRGALATICPADKKLLHGMKDAILVPTAIDPRG
jgi:hypothetical protein